MPTYTKRTPMPVPVEELFAYHARPGALERLLPPWQHVEVIERRGDISDGGRVALKMRMGLLRFRWVAEHFGYVENQQFSDRQVKGPFAEWVHHHRCLQDFEQTSILEDAVEYRVPWYGVGMGGKTARDLERMFRFRHARTRHDLARHAAFRASPRQTVAITGATGLIGSALAAFLSVGGHAVVPVARSKGSAGPIVGGEAPIVWNTATGELSEYRKVDTLVHLAGKNIAERWSEKAKREIVASRVDATEKLCRTIAALPADQRPRLMIAASAIGFYGDRGDEVLDESSPAPPAGAGFLPDTCRAWEAATKSAEDAGVRVVHVRIGVVLSPKGGVVKKLYVPTKLGASGPIGSGGQWMPWISLDDLVGLIHHIMMTAEAADLRGAINGVSPNPVRQRDFARIFARVLHRPAIAPMPAFVVKTLFGQMGREVLLGSSRVVPRRQPAGFALLHPELDGALRAELGL